MTDWLAVEWLRSALMASFVSKNRQACWVPTPNAVILACAQKLNAPKWSIRCMLMSLRD